MLVEGVRVAHVLLPYSVAEAAVHVINETQSPYTVNAGSEVGQDNMASEVYTMAIETTVGSLYIQEEMQEDNFSALVESAQQEEDSQQQIPIIEENSYYEEPLPILEGNPYYEEPIPIIEGNPCYQ